MRPFALFFPCFTKVGDILIINSGDKIAIDGVILEGFASVDESMITGESISVEKEIGEEVIGVLSQINPDKEEPQANDLNKIGTVAKILRLFKMPDGNLN